jgi:hypothetical protein
MKAVVTSVLSIFLFGACVFGGSSDPVYVVNFSQWGSASYQCKNQGGILHYAFYKDGSPLSGVVCKEGEGDVRKPAYVITPVDWMLGVKACKGNGTLLQLEVYFRPQKSKKVICKSGAVYAL